MLENSESEKELSLQYVGMTTTYCINQVPAGTYYVYSITKHIFYQYRKKLILKVMVMVMGN